MKMFQPSICLNDYIRQKPPSRSRKAGLRIIDTLRSLGFSNVCVNSG